MSLTLKEKQALNHVAPTAPHLGDSIDRELQAGAKVSVADYDFLLLGGAQQSIGLGVTLPEGAIVSNVKTDVVLALASGGAATVQVVAGASELIAATAFDDVSLVDIDDHAVANEKLAAESEIAVVIAAADLTAGRMRLAVEWTQGLV